MRSIVVLLLAVVLTGGPALAQQGRGDQASRYFEDGARRFEQNDVAGAVIQLKNAIRADPAFLAAHVLLGRASLAQGDAAAAEASFERALELGVDRSEIAVPMAQALLDQAKFERLLERYTADRLSAPRKVELLVIRGNAQRGLGDLAAADRSYSEAHALDPKAVPPLLARADLLLQQGKREDAQRASELALAAAPGDPRSWHVRGKVALAAGDTRAALEAYSKAIAIDPSDVDGRIGRGSILLQTGDLDGAMQDAEALRRISPQEPRGTYLRAVLAARRGDEQGVRQALLEIVEAIDRIPRDVLRRRTPELLSLGGLAYYGLNQNEKARVYFEDLLLVRPQDVGARKVLASILLAQGWPREAVDVLEPARRAAPRDPDVLALLASAQMARRRFDLASTYLEEALRLSGDAPEIRAKLGFSQLGAGNEQVAAEQLERAFRSDPSQSSAGMTLAVLELRRGRAKAAVEIADLLVKRDPANPLLLNLLGAARGAAGDPKGARLAYEGALRAKSDFLPAQLNLARLDAAEGNGARARERLQAVLRATPKERRAMFELALIDEREGRTEEAIRMLEKVRALDRRYTAATVRLVDLLLRTRAFDRALEVAKDADGVAPDNLQVLAALGRVYLAMGNQAAAQTIFARMARLASFDPVWQTDIARYQLAAGQPRPAAASLEKALSADPGYLPAEVLLAEIELVEGDVPAAERRAQRILKRHPDRAIGYRLSGDVAVARKQYAAAAESYRVALNMEPSPDTLLRAYRALLQAGNPTKANDFIAGWLKSHPDDGVAMRAMAEGHLRAGRFAAARALYESILKRSPDDPDVLNNLAQIMILQQDPKAAEVADRAFKLAPADPFVQGTLGWTLVRQGQPDAGLRHLREARLRAPESAEIRFYLATALAQTGRPDEARRELEQALARGEDFPGSADARKLLKELQAK